MSVFISLCPCDICDRMNETERRRHGCNLRRGCLCEVCRRYPFPFTTTERVNASRHATNAKSRAILRRIFDKLPPPRPAAPATNNETGE